MSRQPSSTPEPPRPPVTTSPSRAPNWEKMPSN
jgi:hypothetical protein